MINKKLFISFFYFVVIPIIFAFILDYGFSHYILQYQQPDPSPDFQPAQEFSKEAFSYLWNIVLLSFIVGTLIVSVKLDKRTNRDKYLELSGYIIIISGVVMLFGMAIQGLYIKFICPIIAKIGGEIIEIGLLVLFFGISMLFITTIIKFYTTFREKFNLFYLFLIMLLIFIAWLIGYLTQGF